jgi:hypothetical protein
LPICERDPRDTYRDPREAYREPYEVFPAPRGHYFAVSIPSSLRMASLQDSPGPGSVPSLSIQTSSSQTVRSPFALGERPADIQTAK